MVMMKLAVAAIIALESAAVASAMQFSCQESYLNAGQTTVCTAVLSSQGAAGNVVFYIDSASYTTGTLDSQGRASFTLPGTLSVGDHQLEAGFFGGPSNGQYHQPESAYTSVTIQ